MKNLRLSLRQGDVPSMFYFAYGIDPLINHLEKKLTGILIHSMPVLGPVESSSAKLVLDPIEERYRVISYADDIKPAVTNLAEFSIINNAAALFESASGCCLHRDPASEKCKVLLLGKWKNTLKQADLPGDCQYIKIADHLDMLGVQLKSSWTQTRKTKWQI